jgi:hypothetical protein
VPLGNALAPTEGVRWLGRRNVAVPRIDAGTFGNVEPPVIVCDQCPLDVVSRLGFLEEHKRRPVVLVVDATDFEPDGSLNLGAERRTSGIQHDLVVRTDFQRFADFAKKSHLRAVKSGKVSIRDHLCAEKDPYVFTCPNTTMFRGGRDDGFPFMDTPMQFTCVVTAMTKLRPAVTMATNEISGEKNCVVYH